MVMRSKVVITIGISRVKFPLPNAAILMIATALTSGNKCTQHGAVSRVSIHCSVLPVYVRIRVYSAYSHSARWVAEGVVLKNAF